MSFRLFIDDIRNPPKDSGEWVIARSSAEALKICLQQGIPEFISFDHDLGESDTSMVFLKQLELLDTDAILHIVDYQIHSANPVGSLNIKAFMDSWKRSKE